MTIRNMGILLIEDSRLCHEVYNVLVEHLGEPIQQIGDIELSDTI
jgi:hypothetical protein